MEAYKCHINTFLFFLICFSDSNLRILHFNLYENCIYINYFKKYKLNTLNMHISICLGDLLLQHSKKCKINILMCKFYILNQCTDSTEKH